jgi:hypothetical protein
MRPRPNAPAGRIRETGEGQAKQPPPSTNENQASYDLQFAKRLVMDKPDLRAELETLQKKIYRDRRGSLMIPKLVPLTLVGLLALSIAASGAY